MVHSTELFIGGKKVSFLKQGVDVGAKVHDILIRRNGTKWYRYYDFNNLSNTQKIRLRMKGLFQVASDLKIPDEILVKLQEYIQSQNKEGNKGIGKREKFDCFDFANFITGRNLSDKLGDVLDLDQEEFIASNLVPGDLVFTAESKEIFSERDNYNSIHYMIYIGKGLFLSKGGSTGPIIITNIKNIKKSYPFDYIRIIRNKD